MSDLEGFRRELRRITYFAAGCGVAAGIGTFLAAVLFFGWSGGFR